MVIVFVFSSGTAGELVLRDGEYIRHDDIHIVLEGVFIPQLGHLRYGELSIGSGNLRADTLGAR